MIEEYENWEDNIRRTFIELAEHMDTNKNSKPLESIIDYALKHGADLFFVNNAKDELRKLREEVDNLRSQFDKPSAWGRINKQGDMFDLRLQCNPYLDQETVVPLYIFRKGN